MADDYDPDLLREIANVGIEIAKPQVSELVSSPELPVDPTRLHGGWAAATPQVLADIESWKDLIRTNLRQEPVKLVVSQRTYDWMEWQMRVIRIFRRIDMDALVAPRLTRVLRRINRRRQEFRWWREDRRMRKHPERYL